MTYEIVKENEIVKPITVLCMKIILLIRGREGVCQDRSKLNIENSQFSLYGIASHYIRHSFLLWSMSIYQINYCIVLVLDLHWKINGIVCVLPSDYIFIPAQIWKQKALIHSLARSFRLKKWNYQYTCALTHNAIASANCFNLYFYQTISPYRHINRENQALQ